MNIFQERLQELLEECSLSRLALANKIGISSTTVNGYFNKNYYPELSIAIKMANYFNCSLDYLFGLSDNKEIANKNNKPFFENFKALLKLSNLSIASVLKKLQMSEYNYYRWKEGKIPKTNNLLAIASYFEVGVDYLVGNVK